MKSNKYISIILEKIDLNDQTLLKPEHSELDFSKLQSTKSKALTKLHVSNLPFTITKASLIEVFEPYGDINEAQIVNYHLRDHDNDPVKIFTGEALINFDQRKEYDKALNGTHKLNGRKLRVNAANEMPEHETDSAVTLYREVYKTVKMSNDFKRGGEGDKKQIVGDLIFPIVEQYSESSRAPKITGMLLDQTMD